MTWKTPSSAGGRGPVLGGGRPPMAGRRCGLAGSTLIAAQRVIVRDDSAGWGW
jgi:hypothetical protein